MNISYTEQLNTVHRVNALVERTRRNTAETKAYLAKSAVDQAQMQQGIEKMRAKLAVKRIENDE